MMGEEQCDKSYEDIMGPAKPKEADEEEEDKECLLLPDYVFDHNSAIIIPVLQGVIAIATELLNMLMLTG
jgi:hypothetical protein